MDNNMPIQGRTLRRVGALLVLFLYVLSHVPSASAAVAFLVSVTHSDDHRIAFRADGNHFDIVLSHGEEHESTGCHEEEPNAVTAAFSFAHDHEGSDHVLHFGNGNPADHFKARVNVPLTVLQAFLPAVFASASVKPAPVNFVASTVSPPASSETLICLRTVLLLV